MKYNVVSSDKDYLQSKGISTILDNTEKRSDNSMTQKKKIFNYPARWHFETCEYCSRDLVQVT